jgi:hypothetical protein
VRFTQLRAPVRRLTGMMLGCLLLSSLSVPLDSGSTALLATRVAPNVITHAYPMPTGSCAALRDNLVRNPKLSGTAKAKVAAANPTNACTIVTRQAAPPMHPMVGGSGGCFWGGWFQQNAEYYGIGDVAEARVDFVSCWDGHLGTWMYPGLPANPQCSTWALYGFESTIDNCHAWWPWAQYHNYYELRVAADWHFWPSFWPGGSAWCWVMLQTYGDGHTYGPVVSDTV